MSASFRPALPAIAFRLAAAIERFDARGLAERIACHGNASARMHRKCVSLFCRA